MTILIAGLRYEANSFAPGRATLDAFRRRRLVVGDDVLAHEHADAIAGAVCVARDTGARLVGALSTWGGSGPVVADDAYAELRDALLARIERHAGDVDGVFVALHGAMLAEGQPDPEGEVLQAIRARVGRDVPIAVALDLHCHFTDAMAAAADVAVGYRTCPHVDIVRTGEQAMGLLLDALHGRITPRVLSRRLPMITPAEHHDTRHGPMREVMAVARAVESRPGVLASSVFATQPWLDVERVGWRAAVVIDAGQPDAYANASRALDELTTAMWERRRRFLVAKTPIEEALASVRARPRSERPFVLADGSDSPSAGSTGDGVALLRTLLEQDFDDQACVIVTDAPAARACRAAGVGADVNIHVGGTLAPRFFDPVRLAGRVAGVRDGRYRSLYPPGSVDRGTIAVVQVGEISVVLTELPAAQLDRELYRFAGVDLDAMRIVQVKSAGGFREHYEPIAAGVIDLAGVGPASSDLESLPFTRISRPLFPFDDIQEPA